MIFLLALLLFFFSPKPALALFSDTAEVAGIEIKTAASFAPPVMTLKVDGKTIAETITGNWIISGDVADLGTMFRLGRSDYTGDNGNYIWENRLMQSFQAGAKTLALDYDFHSTDSGSYDDPGLLIRLNGQEIFATSAASLVSGSSGWQRFYHDLSGYPDTGLINLAIYSGNTGDTANQSWTYIANVTTDIIVASDSAQYQVTGTTVGGAADCGYEITDQVLTYRCTGVEGTTNSQTVTAITDTATPSAVTDLAVTSVGNNTVVLTWHAPAEADRYDVRFSTSALTADNFSAAAAVDKAPAPKYFDTVETLEVLGLNPETTYWFALKSLDAAGNISPVSNIVSETTSAGSDINNGDIVINELMWMGTGGNTHDEYIELRNTTNRTINLSDLHLNKLEGGSMVNMGIDFSGKSISPGGYFLITNYIPGSGSSHIKSGIPVDIVSTAVELSNTAFEIELADSFDTVIDRAGDGGAPKEGLHESGSKYYSMERLSTPGDGASALSWYTCIDSASSGDFFTTSQERGTPGAANRSVNEPVPMLTPRLSLALSADQKSLEMLVENISGYISLNYEITYDTQTALQGLTGKADFAGERQLQRSFLLGTCSAGGTCVYHQEAKNFKAKVILFSPELILEQTL